MIILELYIKIDIKSINKKSYLPDFSLRFREFGKIRQFFIFNKIIKKYLDLTYCVVFDTIVSV